jgi:hypothetical protein
MDSPERFHCCGATLGISKLSQRNAQNVIEIGIAGI